MPDTIEHLEKELRNKELAELARLKAKYEGQQDDLQ